MNRIDLRTRMWLHDLVELGDAVVFIAAVTVLVLLLLKDAGLIWAGS